MKRILVTGGAGFLGSHLCERLLAQGHRLICVDNMSTGRIENLRHLVKDYPGFQILPYNDVCNEFYAEVDEIYNLACPASPEHYRKNPMKTIKTNILGAMHMCNLAQVMGAKLVHASTSEIYGEPIFHPQHELNWGYVNPIGDRACYAESKRCAETIIAEAHRAHKIDVKIARIFNTYGPGMRLDDGRVMPNFITQAIRGDEITIYGDGKQTRSFCYVDDLIDGLIALMASTYRGPINLGNDEEITIADLAQLIIEMTGSKSHLTRVGLPYDDPRRRRPDIHRAEDLLGWTPKTDLRTGLRKTIDYFISKLRDTRSLT